MSGGVDFAQVFEQTRERLRDPIMHFRDLDLMLPRLSAKNANHLRTALDELLGLRMQADLRAALAFALASMCEDARADRVSSDQDYLAGIVYGVQVAKVIDGEVADRLRELISQTARVLLAKQLERLRRRIKARKARAKQLEQRP